jgi:hypothetical protein
MQAAKHCVNRVGRRGYKLGGEVGQYRILPFLSFIPSSQPSIIS